MKANFYDPETGVISSRSYSGPARLLADNTPPGLLPVEGVTDWRRQRVDLQSGALVCCELPLPDPAAERQALARNARRGRAGQLAATDWVVTRAAETGQPVPPEWAAYRQALRDVPAQAGFPDAIDWPALPG